MAKWVGLLFTTLVGCSGSADKPAEAPKAEAGRGKTLGDPVMTCGPAESYDYVASKFRCPDGSNPFGGDARHAAEARRGSQQSPNSNHLIDAYEVPCPAGPVIVYVDLYGCPEQVQRLEELQADQSGGVPDRFERGDFQGVIAQCQSFGDDAPRDARVWCAGLVPASLYVLGRDAEALLQLAGTCGRMVPSSPQEDGRASLIGMVMYGLAQANQAGYFQRDEAARNELVSSWLTACQVSEGELKSAVDRMRQGN